MRIARANASVVMPRSASRSPSGVTWISGLCRLAVEVMLPVRAGETEGRPGGAGSGFAVVDLVAADRPAAGQMDFVCARQPFCRTQHRGCRQQAEAGQLGAGAALQTVRIGNRPAEHLVAAADADNLGFTCSGKLEKPIGQTACCQIVAINLSGCREGRPGRG